MATPCVCTDKRCPHPNGQPCGALVEDAQEIVSGDYPGGDFKPLVQSKKPICDECLKRTTSLWDKMTEKFYRFWPRN